MLPYPPDLWNTLQIRSCSCSAASLSPGFQSAALQFPCTRFLFEFAHPLSKPCQFQEKALCLNYSLLDFKWTLCLPDIDLWLVFPCQPFKTVAVTMASYFHIVSESDSNYFPLELTSMSLHWLISKGYYKGKYRSSFSIGAGKCQILAAQCLGDGCISFPMKGSAQVKPPIPHASFPLLSS